MPEKEEVAGPVLAGPEALSKVGQGVSDRVSETVDNTGKALAAVAGLGVFFFATGYFVEWQRLKRGGLPPEQVLPLLPKAQIAAAGVRELAISILLGGSILALLGFGLVALARATRDRTGRLARRLNSLLEREVAVPTALIGGVTLLIVPFNKVGLLVAAIVTGLVYYGLRLVHRFLADGEEAKFPLWSLTLAVGVTAVVLSGARQHEFPEPRPMAIAVLKNGETLKATYIASDSEKVMFRLWHPGLPTELIVVRSEELKSVRLMKSSFVFRVDRSLLDGVVDTVFPGFGLTCIPPECRWRKGTRIGPSSFF
jgi:hypothetical protein